MKEVSEVWSENQNFKSKGDGRKKKHKGKLDEFYPRRARESFNGRKCSSVLPSESKSSILSSFFGHDLIFD